MILCLILICAVTALFICWMLLIWERVPGMIHIRAGVQQELDPFELCCAFLKDIDEEEKAVLRDVINTIQETDGGQEVAKR